MPGWLQGVANAADSWKRLGVALAFLVTTFIGGVTMGVNYATSEIRAAVRINSSRIDLQEKSNMATNAQVYKLLLSNVYLADAIDPASTPAEKRAALRKMRELGPSIPYVGKER